MTMKVVSYAAQSAKAVQWMEKVSDEQYKAV